VPTESDKAATVKVQVALPTDTPIASVSVQPHPGWTYKVTNTPLSAPLSDGHGGNLTQVVGQIEWTAAGADTAIKPGEYETFRIAAGPLPKTDRLIFKVLQTYDDGQVVRWIDQPAAAGAGEPDHPAAVLSLAASAGRTSPGVACRAYRAGRDLLVERHPRRRMVGDGGHRSCCPGSTLGRVQLRPLGAAQGRRGGDSLVRPPLPRRPRISVPGPPCTFRPGARLPSVPVRMRPGGPRRLDHLN